MTDADRKIVARGLVLCWQAGALGADFPEAEFRVRGEFDRLLRQSHADGVRSLVAVERAARFIAGLPEIEVAP